MVFVLFCTELLCLWSNPCFLSDERGKVVFCYVNEVTFGPHLRMGAGCRGANLVIRGLELSVPPPSIWREERGSGLTPSPVAVELVSHACVMKPPCKPKRTGLRGLLGWGTHGDLARVVHGSGHGSSTLFPIPSPARCFHLAVREIYALL